MARKIAAVALLLMLAACDDIKVILVNEVPRPYRFFVPASYDASEPLPLVIAFHGTGSNSEEFRNITGFNEIAETERFFVLYPESPLRYWRLTGFEASVEDIDYVEAVLDDFMSDYEVDRHRIYVVGFSQGGIMATEVVCQLSTSLPVSALATVSSASLPDVLADRCVLARLPVLLIQSDLDRELATTRPVNIPPGARADMFFGNNLSLEYWRDRNNCGTTFVSQLIDNLEFPADRTQVIAHVFEDCFGTAPLQYYEIVGGGHSWAGGDPDLQFDVGGTVSEDIHASTVIWNFFKANSR